MTSRPIAVAVDCTDLELCSTLTKNRLHLDVAPVDGSQAAEVERLVALGATRLADDPAQHWVVLADPEGNEFCVLPPRDPVGLRGGRQESTE